MSVSQRRIDLRVEDAELEARRAKLPAPAETPARGYSKLYAEQVLQADGGCDFRMLRHPSLG